MLEFSSDDPLAEPALSALYHAAPDAHGTPTLRYRLENQPAGWMALAPKKAPFGPGTLEEAFGFLEWRITEDVMASRDAVFLHAAGVRMGGSNVLIVGASGTGKSTLAAHLFARGHQLWGDDLVQFASTQRQFSAVQRSLKLDANTLESLSLLAVICSEGTQGTLFAPHAVFVSPAALRQDWQAPTAAADAVVILEAATHHGPARLETIGAAEAALIAARALMGGGTSSNSEEQAELMARVLEAMSDLKAYRAAGSPASSVADALERVIAA
ncbi:MAG TPA: hypothetical protein VGI92_05740 [Gemmatimonadales bacterium]